MPAEHPVTDFLALARLEERRLATGISEVAEESRPFAGGVMCRGVPGTWLNGAYGAGLNGPVAPEEVKGLIEFHASRGIEPRVELAPFADHSLIRALADEGFVVRLFETVFHRRLDEGMVRMPDVTADGVTVRPVDPEDQDDVEEFARIATSGFLPPGESEWPEEMYASVRRVARHPRVTSIKAFIGGRCIAAGSMECMGEIASLFGLSVDAGHRRRGVQQAMIAWRLRRARELGARVATISTRPGVATERNAQRAGFAVAYTRSVLVRPGPGLVPVKE